MFPKPWEGLGLQLPHRLGHGDDWRDVHKCVNVISGAADGIGLVAEVLRDARDVCPKSWGIGNCEHAIFGGEDEVIQDRGVGVGDCAVPSGLGDILTRSPGTHVPGYDCAPCGLGSRALPSASLRGGSRPLAKARRSLGVRFTGLKPGASTVRNSGQWPVVGENQKTHPAKIGPDGGTRLQISRWVATPPGPPAAQERGANQVTASEQLCSEWRKWKPYDGVCPRG